MGNNDVQYGIDQLVEKLFTWKEKRIAMVTNDAAKTSSGISSRMALVNNGYNITKLFSPEHGITIQGEDGVAQQNATDILTGLPVISLYGEKLAPTEEDLQDIDIVLFDIPDIGCRFYTYLWTMTHVMEACATCKKKLILLDRPNPIGASLEKAEGPMLDETNCSSFLGRWSIPVKHGCTLGELANYFAAIKLSGLELEIINLKNYQRHYTAAYDFSFVPTSPAITDIQTAMFYPGMGLLEGVNVDEGRGTETPFRVFGAPWILMEDLQKELQEKLPAVKVKGVRYRAQAGMYKNEWCNGVELSVENEGLFSALETGIIVLQTLYKLYPEQLTERLYKTNINPSGKKHLDLLLGAKDAFAGIQTGKVFVTDLKNEWINTMNNYLLY
ncbi:MAG: DUF1343 domain-containing protein [Chitinophagaceae bacterium]|nr:DUF1343 domain-containing protein [Chitinophagaceae bacterium]